MKIKKGLVKVNLQSKDSKENLLLMDSKTRRKMVDRLNKIWAALVRNLNNPKNSNLLKTPRINWPQETKYSLLLSPTLHLQKSPTKANTCNIEAGKTHLKDPSK
jgi:hypothetical protein